MTSDLEKFWQDVRERRGKEVEVQEFITRGIDPRKPAEERPGHELKVLVLEARYAAGIQLWHHGDATFESASHAHKRSKKDLFTNEAMVELMLRSI